MHPFWEDPQTFKEEMLRFAITTLATKPGFTDKTPEQVYDDVAAMVPVGEPEIGVES